MGNSFKKFVFLHPTIFSLGNAPQLLQNWLQPALLKLHHDAIQFNESLDRNALHAIQEARVRKVLRYAFEQVPFWSRRIRESSLKHPKYFRKLTDIQAIPPTTKQTLKQEREDALIARDTPKRRILSDTTSGSTGVPFRFHPDRNCAEREIAMIFRGPRWVGCETSDEFIRIFYRDFPLLAYAGMNIPARDFSQLDGVIDTLLKKRERKFFLYANLSTMIMLAKRARKRGLMFKPRALLVSSEKMSPEVKDFLVSSFDCPLSDCYGCREIDNVAQTCSVGAMHINTDHCLVEIVDEDGKWVKLGERGRILVTGFNNYVMPFIRYDLGDIGFLQDALCHCGLPLPTLDLEGRALEFITLPSGRVVHPFNLTGSFNRRFHLIEQYQIVRENERNFRVSIVPLRLEELDARAIRDELQQVLGEETEIAINMVKEIFRPGQKNVPYVDLTKRKTDAGTA